MRKTRIVIGIVVWMVLAAAAALWQAVPAQAGDDLVQRGRITQLPPGGGAGTWVVGGMTFTADGSTQFDTTEGPLELNSCAKVKYVVQGSTNLALEIDSEPPGDCGGGGGDDDGDDDGDDNDIEVYGVIKSRPAAPEVLGTWEISTTTTIRTFSADGDTEFEQEHGALNVGMCVEVEARSATPTVAEKIESEPGYKCNGTDDDDDGHTEFHAEAYGTVTNIPAGGLGDWTIGGGLYRVTAQTILHGRGGPITVGTYVEVYFRQEGAVRTALKVEAKFPGDDDGDDDGNHGAHDGQAYGLIEQFPASPHTGLWIVSSIRYTATQQTEFEQEDGPFAPGARVKVEYFRDAQGQLIAEEIETTSDNGGVDDGSHALITGFVTGKPAGFVGAWSINNAPFVGAPTTKFKEDHGVLAVGAFVAVEYSTVNGERVMHEIETQVAPGAGSDDRLGRIEGTARAAVGAGAANTWRIGGVEYVVTATTDLNDAGGLLTVGSTALVNSYLAADGAHVATRIQGITIVSRVLLPLTTR